MKPARTDGEGMGDVLLRAAARTPDAPALIEGDVRLSFVELATQATAFARALVHLGVRPGDVVTAQLPNWWETQVVTYGTWLAGGVHNPVVAIYREHELSFIVRQARPKVLVVPYEYRGHDHLGTARAVCGLAGAPVVVAVRAGGRPLPAGVLDLSDLLAGADVAAADAAASRAPDDVALLMYTSGSTADPKGALHSARTLLHEARQVAALARLDDGDAVFMASPLTHITGLLFATVLPVDLGVPAVLQDRWDAGAAVDLIEQHRCTFTVSATTFLLGLTKIYEDRALPSSLRVFVCGGAEIGPALVTRARAAMGTRVVRTYGSTEFPTFTLGDPYGDPELAGASDGRPVPLSAWRVDPASGELLVKGAELFLGYLDASLDAAAFTEDGFFRTGDVVKVDDSGACSVVGRIKDIIIRGGENLSAIEIEDHLQQHPLVDDVAVVAVPDPVLGERACACIVASAAGEPDLEGLRAFLRARGLAAQKAPERLELMTALPRTASGKVQKYLLRRTLAAADSDPPSATPV